MAKKTETEKTDTGATESSEVIKDLATAYRDLLRAYLSSVNEILATGQAAAQDAHKEFIGAINDYQMEFQRTREEEYRSMIGDIQDAFGQEQSQEKIKAAEEKHRANLEEKKNFMTKGIEESSQKYAKALEKIAAQNKKQYDTAYQTFLKGIKREVAGIDLNDFKPETLASLGQIMIHASQYAVAAG